MLNTIADGLRVKSIECSVTLLQQIITEGYRAIGIQECSRGLPDGACFQGVSVVNREYGNATIVALFSHDSWEPIAYGAEVPWQPISFTVHAAELVTA